MSDANRVYHNVLKSGIDYELFVVEGFSDYAEVALKISGKLVSVITIETRRTGNIICRPGLSTKEVLIKRQKQETEEQSEPLTLSDVLSDDEEEASDEESFSEDEGDETQIE